MTREQILQFLNCNEIECMTCELNDPRFDEICVSRIAKEAITQFDRAERLKDLLIMHHNLLFFLVGEDAYPDLMKEYKEYMEQEAQG